MVCCADNITGVIFFSRNIDSVESLAKQIQTLKNIKPNFKFYIDFEGGKVNRFSHLGSNIESSFLLGAHYDSTKNCMNQKSALFRYKIQLLPVAQFYAQLGINTVFGPCIDVLGISPVIRNYARAYSRNIETIFAISSVFIEVFESFGIQCVLKHYPSHAMALGDTHTQCAIDQRAHAEITPELALYRVLIESFPNLGVMMSHCVFPSLCSIPVSLSPYWNEQVKKLTNGDIFTDCLDMDAVDNFLNVSSLKTTAGYKVFSRIDGSFAKIFPKTVGLEFKNEIHGI